MPMAFGAFGKMPAIGDFFRLNTPAGFVSAWDDWVQRGMLAAQTALGAAWDAHYMSAPIWRFSLCAGLAGQTRALGVMMPSVDRVGRRFPLTLMAPLPAAGSVERDHFSHETVFSAAETLALDALEDGMSRDLLEQRLSDLPPVAPSQAGSSHAVAGGIAVCSPTGTGVLPDLAARGLATRIARPSVWSTVVGDTERLLVCDGLPNDAQMQALFHLDGPAWNGAALA